MRRYPLDLKKKVQQLRSGGKTYSEIKTILDLFIPKSTLSDWCRNVVLPEEYIKLIEKLNIANRNKGRFIAWQVNKQKREAYLKNIKLLNFPTAQKIEDVLTAKIALAMLCLGEASKYSPKGGAAFYLGNSNPKIIKTFLELLKRCYDFKIEKVRCTVQCRADQNVGELEAFWSEVTGIPLNNFYKARIDPRTIGKPTLKIGYKGVLRVDYFDNTVRLDLESLADLIYIYLTKSGPEV